MKCKKCGSRTCGCDACDFCNDIICIGLCTSCNTDQKCGYCGNNIKLKEQHDHVQTLGYEYFCNREHYDKWKEKRA